MGVKIAWTSSTSFILSPSTPTEIAVKQDGNSLYIVSFCCKFWRVPIYDHGEEYWCCPECKTKIPQQQAFKDGVGNQIAVNQWSERKTEVKIQDWIRIWFGYPKEDIHVNVTFKD
jgi:hypothetical protein